jgi:Bacterial archaeo-eukaryotic release factor family 10
MVNFDDVKQLLAENGGQILSLYLDVDGAKQENQASQPAWRIYLKDALDALETQFKPVEIRQSLRERVDAFFNSYAPDSKGLVAFFTADSERIYELPVPVEPRWHFGDPLILPLLWTLDEYEPYVIVRVDQEQAELITAYLGRVQVEDRLENDLFSYDFAEKTFMPPTSVVVGGHLTTAGSNREAYQSMINEHIAGFYREVVEHVTALQKQQPKTRIIVGGSEQAAHAVRELLPEQLMEVIDDVVALPRYLSGREVLQQVLPITQAYEREQEMKLVEQVIDFAKAGGRGALGRQAVVQALEMKLVELLILLWPTPDEAQANDLTLRTFASGGTVEFAYGAAADRLREEGGIAARLYYPL